MFSPPYAPLLLLFIRLGCPTRLLFNNGPFEPTLFPTIFLETELDFSGLRPSWLMALPPNEFFLMFTYYFWMGFFLIGTSSVIPYYFWASSLFLAMSSASSSLLIIILMAFLFCLGNISYFAFKSSLFPPSCGFLNYLTLSAYLRVFSVF